MEPQIEIEYNEYILDALANHEFASIELGEWTYVWVGDEERKDLADALASGKKSLEDVMKELEYQFNLDPKLWLKAYDKDADATLYVLVPKFLGVFAEHFQVYLGSICKCGCPIGVGVICNAPMPWDCLHSTAMMCIKCGEEIAKIGAVHGGGWGNTITLREFEALREMAVVVEGDEE